MTRTVVASATKEIVIGFDQPFCVIGERINPTGRKKLAAEMVEGNFETVKADVIAQAAAGAPRLGVHDGSIRTGGAEGGVGVLWVGLCRLWGV